MQRLRKVGLKIDELTQNPANLTAMAQNLFDLFRTERFVAFPNAKLRDVITRTVFEETSGGLRFAKNQPIKIDLTVALAMACLAATQRSGKSGYRLDVFDENFRDEDLPPLPEPTASPAELQPDCSNWHEWRQGQLQRERHLRQLQRQAQTATPTELRPPTELQTADKNLLNLYSAIDSASKWSR